MKIYDKRRKVILHDLMSVETFLDYCINSNLINNLKSRETIPQHVIEKINRMVIDEQLLVSKKIFKIKMLNKIFYGLTLFNKNYWIDRGWSEEEANEKISIEQQKRGKIGAMKSAKLKENNYEEWAKTKNVTLEFYINKGFTEDEAKLELSKRQSTFSKENCIKKHGQVIGEKIFKNRQAKWINTLSNKSEDEKKSINSKKDSNTIYFYKKKYGDLWMSEFLSQSSYLNAHLQFIEKTIKNNLNFQEFIDNIKNNNDFLFTNTLHWIFSSKIVQEYYNVSYDEIKDALLKSYGNQQTIQRAGLYGYVRLFDGHLFRSTGEYIIAKFLVDNSIKYEYEKNYPYQSVSHPYGMRYDFFLPEHKLYIEYAGLLFKKNNLKYSERLNEKIQHCKKFNLKYFISSDYSIILQELNKLIKNQKT